MKQSEAKDFFPLIQAWSEGKELQYYSPVKGWIPVHNPDFSNSVNNYRIKPEPVVKEMYLSRFGDTLYSFSTSEYRRVRVIIEEI